MSIEDLLTDAERDSGVCPTLRKRLAPEIWGKIYSDVTKVEQARLDGKPVPSQRALRKFFIEEYDVTINREPLKALQNNIAQELSSENK